MGRTSSLARSRKNVQLRWVEKAMEAMSVGATPALPSASREASIALETSSGAFCSTQFGLG